MNAKKEEGWLTGNNGNSMLWTGKLLYARGTAIIPTFLQNQLHAQLPPLNPEDEGNMFIQNGIYDATASLNCNPVLREYLKIKVAVIWMYG